MSTDDIFLKIFAPEEWTPARRFRFFIGPPFQATRQLFNATSAIENRQQKFFLLAALAHDLRQGLLDDRQELESHGYTPATRSKQFAAVAETLFLELYACLDNVRTAIYAIYGNVHGISKSTPSLFRLAHECKYGPEFPEPLRERLAVSFSSWFPELQQIRNEISHGDVGHCSLDVQSGRVSYLHVGLGTPQRAFVIEGLAEKINNLSSSVFELVNFVFMFFCSCLEPVEVRVSCGMYRGRVYERTVAHSKELGFDSGKCVSRVWFEQEAALQCPMRFHCGAYRN